MNKVLNINLGGYPFTIDEDAYDYLSNYLDTIHHHFQKSEGYDEITSDIESRMAELFEERLGKRAIVTLGDVKEGIATMGTPEDFGAEPLEAGTNYAHTDEDMGIKTGKRMFRDPQDKVVGGVCSGLSAYLGIRDALWIRIAFVVFTITGGMGILLYLVMWAILPKAETAADRLAMKGEPINVSTIAKNVEHELENFSEKISEWSDDLNSKKKSKLEAGQSGIVRTIKKGIAMIGIVFAQLFSLIVKIWKPILFIAAIAGLAVVTVSWIAMIIGFVFSLPFSNYLLPNSPFLSTLGFGNILFIVGIPLFLIATFFLRLAFGTRLNSKVSMGLWLFWGVNLFSFFGMGSYMARQFNQEAKLTTSYNLPSEDYETVTVRFAESESPESMLQLGRLDITEDFIVSKSVRMNIEKSDDPTFRIDQWNRARGSNLDDASELVEGIDYEIDINENTITIRPDFFIEKGRKWRAQNVQLTLHVPEGKNVEIEGYTHRILNHFERNRDYSRTRVKSGQLWTMTDKGFQLMNPEKEEERGILSYENFSKLDLEGNMKAYIQQGDAFKVRIAGIEHYHDPFEIVQNGDLLHIKSKIHHNQMRVYISMPELQHLDLDGTDDVKISDFTQANMYINNDSRHDVDLMVNVDSVFLQQSRDNKITLTGKGSYLNAHLEKRAELDAHRYFVKTADVNIERSQASLAVSDTLRQRVDRDGKVVADGRPLVLNTVVENE